MHTDGPGQHPLPTLLMVGLSILKHTHDLSDEELERRRVENPYFQFFCGEEFFRHTSPLQPRCQRRSDFASAGRRDFASRLNA
jgi:hypothetical protein